MVKHVVKGPCSREFARGEGAKTFGFSRGFGGSDFSGTWGVLHALKRRSNLVRHAAAPSATRLPAKVRTHLLRHGDIIYDFAGNCKDFLKDGYGLAGGAGGDRALPFQDATQRGGHTSDICAAAVPIDSNRSLKTT